MPVLPIDYKKRILLKLTSSRFWGACIVTAILSVALFVVDNETIKGLCIAGIIGKWGSYDFSKKVNP